MRCLPALCVASTTLTIASSAFAAPPIELEGLQRNGALSRHVWRPDAGKADLGGLRLSAGVAIGLRGGVRDNLDRSVAPALGLELRGGASLTLLPASGGAMLVWQSTR